MLYHEYREDVTMCFATIFWLRVYCMEQTKTSITRCRTTRQCTAAQRTATTTCTT